MRKYTDTKQKSYASRKKRGPVVSRHLVVKMKVKKGDTVMIVSGKDKGKTGEIVKVLPSVGRVVVDGVAMMKRHLRRTGRGQSGSIVERVASRSERFIVFCDDLSFDEGDVAYKALKVALDGSIAAASDNVLIYATSNRRHLLPEYFHENAGTRHIGEEIHPAEAIEEKVSLSERFGLWVSFYPFDQNQYLAAVNHWLRNFGCDPQAPEVEREALNWSLARGMRSGRVAWQFARDWAGRHG
jgi:ribosomal protein L24